MDNLNANYEQTYDVLVAGAGVAGVAAALACARAGLHTALVEKTVLLGGLATTGLINHYLPLCDGRGNQTTFGIAEEMLHLSIKYGPGDVPDAWLTGQGGPKARYQTPFSPAAFVLALDEVVEQAGIALWLDTLVCQPVMTGNRIVGLEVENKSGRGLLKASCVIDATGAADIAYRAGAPCGLSDNWLSLWAVQASLDRAQKVVANPEKVSLLEVIRLGAGASGRGMPPDMDKLDGTDAAQVTRFVLEGRRLLREHYQTKQATGGSHDRRNFFPVTLPAMAQFRTTRRIDGHETLEEDDADKSFSTSIGVISDWREAGIVWEIPYGTLLPRQVTGLLVAGRCISSVGSAWEATRVIPPAALTGQVAGIAATLAVQRKSTPNQIHVEDLQRQLRREGIPYHISDVIRS